MPNNLTDVAEVRVLDWLNGVGTPARPTTPLRVALYTTAPNQETGAGGVEVSAGGYFRQDLTMGAAANGASTNTADVVFGPATATWGTVVAAGIFDSAGTPALLWVGTLSASKTIETGDTFRIPSGQLTISLN